MSHLQKSEFIAHYAHIERTHLLAWLHDSSFELPTAAPVAPSSPGQGSSGAAKHRSAAYVRSVYAADEALRAQLATCMMLASGRGPAQKATIKSVRIAKRELRTLQVQRAVADHALTDTHKALRRARERNTSDAAFVHRRDALEHCASPPPYRTTHDAFALRGRGCRARSTVAPPL